MAPPPYSRLLDVFGPLEQYAQSAGNGEAWYLLRKANMSFLAAHAAKPTQNPEMRMVLLNRGRFGTAQQHQ